MHVLHSSKRVSPGREGKWRAGPAEYAQGGPPPGVRFEEYPPHAYYDQLLRGDPRQQQQQQPVTSGAETSLRASEELLRRWDTHEDDKLSKLCSLQKENERLRIMLKLVFVKSGQTLSAEELRRVMPDDGQLHGPTAAGEENRDADAATEPADETREEKEGGEQEAEQQHTHDEPSEAPDSDQRQQQQHQQHQHQDQEEGHEQDHEQQAEAGLPAQQQQQPFELTTINDLKAAELTGCGLGNKRREATPPQPPDEGAGGAPPPPAAAESVRRRFPAIDPRPELATKDVVRAVEMAIEPNLGAGKWFGLQLRLRKLETELAAAQRALHCATDREEFLRAHVHESEARAQHFEQLLAATQQQLYETSSRARAEVEAAVSRCEQANTQVTVLKAEIVQRDLLLDRQQAVNRRLEAAQTGHAQQLGALADDLAGERARAAGSVHSGDRAQASLAFAAEALAVLVASSAESRAKFEQLCEEAAGAAAAGDVRQLVVRTGSRPPSEERAAAVSDHEAPPASEQTGPTRSLPPDQHTPYPSLQAATSSQGHAIPPSLSATFQEQDLPVPDTEQPNQPQPSTDEPNQPDDGDATHQDPTETPAEDATVHPRLPHTVVPRDSIAEHDNATRVDAANDQEPPLSGTSRDSDQQQPAPAAAGRKPKEEPSAARAPEKRALPTQPYLPQPPSSQALAYRPPPPRVYPQAGNPHLVVNPYLSAYPYTPYQGSSPYHHQQAYPAGSPRMGGGSPLASGFALGLTNEPRTASPVYHTGYQGSPTPSPSLAHRMVTFADGSPPHTPSRSPYPVQTVRHTRSPPQLGYSPRGSPRGGSHSPLSCLPMLQLNPADPLANKCTSPPRNAAASPVPEALRNPPSGSGRYHQQPPGEARAGSPVSALRQQQAGEKPAASALLRKAARQPLGLVWRPSRPGKPGLVLGAVDQGSPAGAAGCAAFVGRRLLQACGVPVNTAESLDAITVAMTKVDLVFEDSLEDRKKRQHIRFSVTTTAETETF
ncbi:hypothetical protein DIPPA_32162 [Diplonema papillatum]|nr:hypothetical protein DIPPA_32162 [Diplonema papillatum]